MSAQRRLVRRGFTLVELLVVIGIIVILVALTVAGATVAIGSARNARMGIEISELRKAVEAYKSKMGDYPPSMDEDFSNNLYSTVCARHISKCFPNIDPAHRDWFLKYVAPNMPQEKALVFWLSCTANDQTLPFKNLAIDNSGNVMIRNGTDLTDLTNFKNNWSAGNIPAVVANTNGAGAYPGPFPTRSFFNFDTPRLHYRASDAYPDPNASSVPGFQSAYARQTPYVYFDARTYANNYPTQSGMTVNPPLFQNTLNYVTGNSPQPYTDANGKGVNPSTFQIVCSGQDGDFGAANTTVVNQYRDFPAGNNYSIEDKDNITDFSGGARLGDKIPR